MPYTLTPTHNMVLQNLRLFIDCGFAGRLDQGICINLALPYIQTRVLIEEWPECFLDQDGNPMTSHPIGGEKEYCRPNLYTGHSLQRRLSLASYLERRLMAMMQGDQ